MWILVPAAYKTKFIISGIPYTAPLEHGRVLFMTSITTTTSPTKDAIETNNVSWSCICHLQQGLGRHVLSVDPRVRQNILKDKGKESPRVTFTKE